MNANLDTAVIFIAVICVCAVVFRNTTTALAPGQLFLAHVLLVAVVPLVATAMSLTTTDPFPLVVDLVVDLLEKVLADRAG